MLRYYLDAPEAEVAERLGVSTGSVPSARFPRAGQAARHHHTRGRAPMSDHGEDTIQLERLVEADRPHPPAPDLGGLLAAGGCADSESAPASPRSR